MIEISQQKPAYHPVTIKFHQQEDARTFLEMVDKIDSYINGSLKDRLTFSRAERSLIIDISNAFTNGNIVI